MAIAFPQTLSPNRLVRNLLQLITTTKNDHQNNPVHFQINFFHLYSDSCLSDDHEPYYGPTACQDMVQRLPYNCYNEPYKLDCCRECLKIADHTRQGKKIHIFMNKGKQKFTSCKQSFEIKIC